MLCVCGIQYERTRYAYREKKNVVKLNSGNLIVGVEQLPLFILSFLAKMHALQFRKNVLQRQIEHVQAVARIRKVAIIRY